MNKAMIYPLIWLSGSQKAFFSEERFCEEMLKEFKNRRKNLSAKEISDNQLNVYEKHGIPIRTLLKALIEADYVETRKERDVIEVRISEEGINYLMNVYTNNFSSGFLEFKKNVDLIMRKHHEPSLNTLHIASAYWNGRTPMEIAQMYLEPMPSRKLADAYHKHLMQVLNIEPKEDEFVFHFQPMLFLPKNLMDENVSLEIKGVKTPENLVLVKPYPNRRYVVAGFQVGKEKTASGFYPLLLKKEELLGTKEITLIWKIGAKKKVVHNLFLNFQCDETVGDMFSTEQYIVRSNNLDQFSLRTYVEQDEQFWNDRTATHVSKANNQELFIYEFATLTAFPKHLHHAFFSCKYFNKWVESQNGGGT